MGLGTAFLGSLANLFNELGLTALAKQLPSNVAITGGSLTGVSVSATSVAVSGNETVGGTLAVTGNTTLSGYVTLTGEYIATGSNAAYNAVDRSGAASGNGTFYRAGGVNYLWDNAGGNVAGWDSTAFHAYGNATVGGTLAVTGASTFAGPIVANSSLQISGAGTNLFKYGTADGSTYAAYNVNLQLWQSMAISTYDGSVHGRYDARSGYWDCLGGFYVNGTVAIDSSRNGNFAALTASGTATISGLLTANGTISVQGGVQVTGNQVYSAGNGTLYLNYNSTGAVQFGSGPLYSSAVSDVQTAASPRQYIVHNGDGGARAYIGTTYNAMWLGYDNPTGAALTGLAAGATNNYFAITQSGKVGSVTNTGWAGGFPTFRNVLDDGAGNGSVTGTFSATNLYGSYISSSGNVNAAGAFTCGTSVLNGNQLYTTSGTAYFQYTGAASICAGGGTASFGGPISVSGLATLSGGVTTGAACSLTGGASMNVSGWHYGCQQGTYGALGVLGTQNGWGGIVFNDNAGYESGHFMVSPGSNSPTTGFYNSTIGWMWEWAGSTLVVGNVPESQITSPSQSMAASGYRKLPGGLILQWGYCPPNAQVTFPIAFPNAVFTVTASVNVAGDRANGFAANPDYGDKTGFFLSAKYFNGGFGNCSQSAYWTAIGY